MPFEAGAIVGKVDLDGEPSIETMKKISKASSDLKEAVEKDSSHMASQMKTAAEEGENAFKKTAENIKESFGKISAFGEWTEILTGGGALLGLTLAVEELDKMIDKINELNKAVESGKANWFDYSEGIAKMVPVFGQFYELGRKIRESFSGEAEAAKEATERENEFQESLEHHKQIMEEVRTAGEHYIETLRGIYEQMSLVGKTGLSRDLQEIKNQFSDMVHAASQTAGEKALTPDELKRYKDLAEQYKNLKPEPVDTDAIRRRATLNQIAGYTIDPEHLFTSKESPADQVAAAVQEAQQKFTETRTRILSDWRDLQNKMYAGSKNALSTDLAAGLLAAVQGVETFRDHWIAALKPASEETHQNIARIVESFKSLKTEIEQLGLDKYEKMLSDFAHQKDVRPDQVNDYAQGVEKLRQHDVSDALKDVQKAIDQTGMNEFQKMINDAGRNPLFKADDLKKYEDLVSQLETKNLTDTPIQKYLDQMKELQRLRDEGYLSESQFNAQRKKAQDEAFGDLSTTNTYRAGSAEYEANHYDMLQRLAGAPKDDIAHEQVSELKQINANLQKIISGTRSEVPDLVESPTV